MAKLCTCGTVISSRKTFCLACKKERLRKRGRDWYYHNKDLREKQIRAWRVANPDKVQAYSRTTDRKRYKLDPERTRRWLEKNPTYLHEYAVRNRDRTKDRKLRQIHGISLDQYNQLLADQEGVCRICSTPPVKKCLAVDHCHETGLIRGLLCDRCNRGLGYFSDKPDILRVAASYIEHTRSLTP